MKTIWLACESGYEHQHVMGAFTEKAQAELYLDDLRRRGKADERDDNEFHLKEVPLDAPAECLPGAWLVRVGPTGALLCEPDWFTGDVAMRGGRATSDGGYTSGTGWEGGAQAYGLTVEEARAKAWTMVQARQIEPTP